MKRFDAIKRPSQHERRDVYDVFHIWPHGVTFNGVKFTSTCHVYLADSQGSPHRVHMYLPGVPHEEVDLRWGQEWYGHPANFGIFSVTVPAGVRVHAFWEITAGKA